MSETVTFRIGEKLKTDVLREAKLRGISITSFVREALENGIVRSKAKRNAMGCEDPSDG